MHMQIAFEFIEAAPSELGRNTGIVRHFEISRDLANLGKRPPDFMVFFHHVDRISTQFQRASLEVACLYS